MNRAIHFTFLNFLFFIQFSFSQSYFVTFRKDTIFCSNIDFATNARGFIKELSYTDKSGNKIELKKRKNIPNIFVIYDSGVIYDRMPLKTNKPYSYHRFGKRIVNGKLCVSKFDNRETRQVYKAPSQYNPMGGYKNVTSGTYLFQLKTAEGKMIKISRRTLKKIIMPYLLNCEKFKNEYKGVFSAEEDAFTQMIIFYNNVCS